MLALRHLRGTTFSGNHLQRLSANLMYWLMKSEPEECSFSDALAATQSTVPWVGVRNYQARNFMRDQMRVGDGVLFYHSSCEVPGIYGLAQVASTPYADATQFDKKSKYYDAKSTPETPRWQLVDVKALKACRPISLADLRALPELGDMIVLARGSRLSITPVAPEHWKILHRLMKPL
jgi:predicted RNA-binding protein with PUA-like domain